MIATTFNYFLGAVPGVGYRLYRMTNSGGAGATLTLQATISSPFTAPTRRVNQPGTANTLDPLDGRIVWSPVNDGNFIWFAHGIDISGFPASATARSLATNTATVAWRSAAAPATTSTRRSPLATTRAAATSSSSTGPTPTPGRRPDVPHGRLGPPEEACRT